MKIIIWNTEWAPPSSNREKIIKETVQAISPDIICITEGYVSTWDDFGHVVSSEEDYGYKITSGRRKVILVSKTLWNNVDIVGNVNLPSGRFVSASTQNIDIVGLCIPWRSAHVYTGRKDRKIWEDHIQYLNTLKDILKTKTGKTFVMGDFNQRIPRKYSREDVFNLMMDTFKGFDIATQNPIQPIDKLSIDHFCSINSNKCLSVESIDNFKDGVKLSDHFGLKIII